MPLVKRRGCLIAVGIAAILVGLAVLGFTRLLRQYTLGMTSPYLYVSTGSNENYQAHFLTEGFQDRSTYLFVPTSDDIENDLQLVDDFIFFTHETPSAVWSKDGSVIACSANVFTKRDTEKSTPSKAERETLFEPEPTCWVYVCAYDFLEKKPILMKEHRRDYSKSDWKIHSKNIEELLNSRGGLGKKVTQRVIHEESKKLDWDQWHIYSTAIRTANFGY